MRAEELRKRLPAIDLEWDFSRASGEDIESWWQLAAWEHAREVPSIRRFVAKLRAGCSEKTFEGFWAAYGQDLRNRDWQAVPRVYDAIFYFAPEWPDSAYLAVPAKERQRRFNLLWPPLGARDLAGRIQDKGCMSSVLSDNTLRAQLALSGGFLMSQLSALANDRELLLKLRRAQRETGSPTIQQEGRALALIEVDWAFTDTQLKEFFAAWLTTHRPPDTTRERRGQSGFVRQHQTEMRQLAAWRLLVKHRLDCAAAEELTSNPQGKPLCEGQDNWLAAKREAETRLREMADYVSGKRPELAGSKE